MNESRMKSTVCAYYFRDKLRLCIPCCVEISSHTAKRAFLSTAFRCSICRSPFVRPLSRRAVTTSPPISPRDFRRWNSLVLRRTHSSTLTRSNCDFFPSPRRRRSTQQSRTRLHRWFIRQTDIISKTFASPQLLSVLCAACSGPTSKEEHRRTRRLRPP